MDQHSQSVRPPAWVGEIRPSTDCSLSLEGDDVVVWLDGEFDASNQALTGQTFIRAVQMGSAEVIVDMRGVEFMGAAMVSTLLMARSWARSGNRALRVRDPSPCASRVLEICGLLKTFSLVAVGEPGEPSALATWVEVPCERRVLCESGALQVSDERTPVPTVLDGRPDEAESVRAGR